MASKQTAEEVEKEYLDVMGSELGTLYCRLYNKCARLQVTWGEYIELFGTSRDRVNLLNQVAGYFFRIVQNTLWENTLLSLTRLTDPPKSAGSSNLTIKRLPGLLDDRSPSGNAKSEVEGLVKKAIEATKFARDWRNRRIAHCDLALTLNQGAKPLEKISREKVKEAIAAVCTVIERVHGIYFKSKLRLDLVIKGSGGAESLLYVIRDGVEHEQAQWARLREGKPLPEDISPPRPI